MLLNTVGSATPDPSSLGLALSSATSIPMALMSLSLMMFSTLQVMVSFERCLEYTELPAENDLDSTPGEEKRESGNLPLPESWPSHGAVEFRNYSASYRPGIAPNVVSGRQFHCPAYAEGCILIDSVNIAKVPLKRLRRAITVIPQDPSLVRGTLRMNLDPTGSHSDDQLWQALHHVHLECLVKGQAAGLDMETADGGTNLSVGQRQLVCLARALLRGSKVLLLDEATSQMDGDTDRLIQATLREAFANSTLIAIAHRIHTVLDYDRILVMDDGRVREFGTPTSLLSDRNSCFYRMALDAGVAAHRSDHLLAVTSL
ncbi:hypothetical protein MTO96_052040 [Rhipicephalus appendiculatus]